MPQVINSHTSAATCSLPEQHRDDDGKPQSVRLSTSYYRPHGHPPRGQQKSAKANVHREEGDNEGPTFTISQYPFADAKMRGVEPDSETASISAPLFSKVYSSAFLLSKAETSGVDLDDFRTYAPCCFMKCCTFVFVPGMYVRTIVQQNLLRMSEIAKNLHKLNDQPQQRRDFHLMQKTRE